MSNLTELPNIGKTLADKLIQAGISSPNELKTIGSENAFIRIKTIDSTACINMLYALEGAVQGIRWHALDAARKSGLKDFYEHMYSK